MPATTDDCYYFYYSYFQDNDTATATVLLEHQNADKLGLILATRICVVGFANPLLVRGEVQPAINRQLGDSFLRHLSVPWSVACNSKGPNPKCCQADLCKVIRQTDLQHCHQMCCSSRSEGFMRPEAPGTVLRTGSGYYVVRIMSMIVVIWW